ncbi:MAG: hypothetical protein HQK75_10890 [Candidatus Magnetomorum sp.]|nr:hypothetical protein [Candidatus Magnetomorum sp.]
MLPLICDIHLQPIRQGLFQSIDELSDYPWTGHLSMMGSGDNQLNECGVQKVLTLFSNTIDTARDKYIAALQKSLSDEMTINFQGGGWMRSTGRTRKDIWNTTVDEMSQYDSRILGSPEFVKQILKTDETLKNKVPENYISIHHLIDKVSKYFGIPDESLFQKNQQKSVSLARCIICYIEIHCLGRSGAVVGKMMKIKAYSALRCAQRGQIIYESDPDLQRLIGI